MANPWDDDNAPTGAGSDVEKDSSGNRSIGVTPLRGGRTVVALEDKKHGALRIFPHRVTDESCEPLFENIREVRLEKDTYSEEFWSGFSEDLYGNRIVKGLPRGFGIRPDFGLSIPKSLRQFFRIIDDLKSIAVVSFYGTGGAPSDEPLDGDHLTLPLKDYEEYIIRKDRGRDRANRVAREISHIEAHNILAPYLGREERVLKEKRSDTLEAISRAIQEDAPLNSNQCEELGDLVRKSAARVATKNPKILALMKDEIDLASIDELISNFSANLTKNHHEDYWQEFLEENDFALKNAFSMPIDLLKAQANVRIANTDDSGRRVVDFLMANPVTKSVLAIEIKTPSKPLVAATKYRGTAGAEVWAVSSEVSGGISQLLGQIGSIRSDLPTILKRDKLGEFGLDSANVRGALICGTIDALDDEQRQSFNAYRETLHGIEIIAFDELLARLQQLRSMMQPPD